MALLAMEFAIETINTLKFRALNLKKSFNGIHPSIKIYFLKIDFRLSVSIWKLWKIWFCRLAVFNRLSESGIFSLSP